MPQHPKLFDAGLCDVEDCRWDEAAILPGPVTSARVAKHGAAPAATVRSTVPAVNLETPSDEDVAALVRLHYEGIQGTYFDELIPRGSTSLLFSDLVADSYYNYIAATPSATIEDCLGAAAEFSSRDRTLAVYLLFESRLRSDLETDGFTEWAADAWLTADLATTLEPVVEGQIATRLVEAGSETDVHEYVDAFKAAFSGDGPSDPYGALDEGYVLARERSVRSSGNSQWPSLFFVASDDGVPVGVAQMVLCGEWVGVYGVGTVPEGRRKGVGATLLNRMAVEARNRGAGKMFLQTEADSRIQAWYESMGFRLSFVAPYFTK